MEKRILFCTNVKDVTALWAQNDLFLKLRDEFSTRYWAYDWTQQERLNNEKQKVNNLNTSRHARNDSKQESRQTKQKTRHTDVHREPVSPGSVSHPFSFVILTSLGPQARFFSQNPLAHFFSQLTPLYSSISHFSSLPGVIWWINGKVRVHAQHR